MVTILKRKEHLHLQFHHHLTCPCTSVQWRSTGSTILKVIRVFQFSHTFTWLIPCTTDLITALKSWKDVSTKQRSGEHIPTVTTYITNNYRNVDMPLHPLDRCFVDTSFQLCKADKKSESQNWSKRTLHNGAQWLIQNQVVVQSCDVVMSKWNTL